MFLMTANAPVTVEVSKVVRKTWKLGSGGRAIYNYWTGRETPDLLEDTRVLL